MKKGQNNTTILRYLLWRILPIIVPVLLAVFILTYVFTHRTIEAQQYKNIESELSFAHQTLDHRFSETKNWLRNLSKNGMIVNSLVDPKGAGEYIPQLFKTLHVPGPQAGGSIELLDFQGKVLATNNIKTTYQAGDHWLIKVLGGERYAAIDHNGMIIAEPITINGLPEGTLVLFFDPPALAEFLEISSAGTHINIIDKQNRILFAPSGQEYFHIGEKYNEKSFKDWVISKKVIDRYPELTLVSAQKNNIAFQAVTDVKYALIGFIVIALGGIFLSISLAGRSVTSVLGNIARQLQILRTEKDLSKRIKVSTIKELADLERSYNKMAEELQDTTVSKEYIDTLFDGMPLPVFVVDTEGHIIRTNEPVLSMFRNVESGLPDHFQDLIFHEDLEKHQENLIKDFGYTPTSNSDAFFYIPQKFGTHEVEMQLNTTKTEKVSYILSTTSLKNYKGKVTGFIITATDIADRKKQEKEILELAEQNTLMARAIEEIDLGITISDGKQRHQPLIFCNQAFIELSGRYMEEILGFSCNFMQGPETDPNTVKALSDAIHNQESITVEILNYKKDGESFWNELSLNPIFSNDGSLKYYVGIQNDITDRKRIEAMKKEFISTVSHELRTPLTSIHGSLGLINDLYEKDENSEEKELLSVAYRNSERLKFLVDDILDTEKLEAGEMRFYPESHELNNILQQGVQLNTAYGEKYGVEFVIVNDLPDIYVCVDKQRIVQVFANLLSNAAKFSKDSKQVDISATLMDFGDDVVRISIRDYGDGISKDFQKRIFTKFAQEDSSDVRTLPGTGLGLYISKKIIESHNGEIDFKTKTGEGTTFYIDLPCHDTPKEKGKNNDETT